MVKELGGDRVKSKFVGEGNECQSARNYKVLSNILSKKNHFFTLVSCTFMLTSCWILGPCNLVIITVET